MRAERSALVVLFGMAAFAWLARAPAFEASLVLFGTAACALLDDGRDGRVHLEHTRRLRWVCVYAPIVLVGALVTRPAWGAAEPFVGLDGRVNEAIVGELLDQASRGRPLTWLTRAAPGDPTLDLYPTLAHRGVAWLARALGRERETARLLVSIVSGAYVAVALGIARTAVRIGAPWPAALGVALLSLLDIGTDFTWGTQPVFRYAFLPSTLSVASLLHALPALFDLHRRPSRARFALAGSGVALSAALHPLALVIACALALVWAFSLAFSAPSSRPARGAALLATALGVAASAWLWLPASMRVFAYGVHYGTPQISLDLALLRMALGALPDGGWMILVALAWLAALLSLFTRGRSEAQVLASLSLLLLASYTETPFVELGLAPSSASVRWQAFRIGAAIKPFSYVLGALAMGSAAQLHALVRARPARARALRGFAALAMVAVAVAGHRGVSSGLRDLERERLEDMVGPPSAAREDIAALRYRLARDQQLRPGGRLLMICGLTCVWELYAFARERADGSAGIEMALSQPAPAGWLLRDQLRTTTPENLRRFGVRWVVAPSRELLPGGDEGLDRRFGTLWLRAVPGWDGSIAHISRGAGSVRAEIVPGEGLDVTLEGTTEAAFVELGTPYYPRLVAKDARSVDVPVYAMPVGAPGADDPNPTFEHAAAMWLRPGTTRLRADRPLGSDLAGLPLSLIAGALALALAHPRSRARLAPLARRLASSRRLAPAVVGLMLTLVVALLVRLRSGPADALRFAAALPTARVFVLDGGGQRACIPDRLGRSFRCPDGASLRTTISYTLHDWHVGWPAPAPAIEIARPRERARYLVELDGQPLEGPYFLQCERCTATLRDSNGAVAGRIGAPTQRLSMFVDAPRLELRASGERATFTVLAARFVEPPFEHPLPPATP